MNEKEILEAINIIEYFEPDDLVESVMYETSMKKIKKLLDLYNKQKEEIEKLENDKRGMLVELYKANDKKDKLKEKNASLQKEIKLMKSININDNYISKDKIREMIKEIGTYTFDSEEEIKKFDYCIYILKELLEE